MNMELFKNPTAEYRGTPFWAWNNKLEEAELLRQIDIFNEMGLGGFHVHSRSGLATEYMGDEFMKLVASCTQKARENKMLCYLYDEDRWPSGAAGGKVTKDYEYRMQYLTICPYGHVFNDPVGKTTARYTASGRRTLLGRYKLTLQDGFLANYQSLPLDYTPAGDENIWDAYLEISGDSPWFNNQAYANTLDKKSIDRFIEETHEKYKQHLGHEFGKTIPSIFTDEPQFSHKHVLPRSDSQSVITLPFTRDFDETYTATYGESFIEKLPEVVWEKTEPSQTRYRYHDHVCERFTQAFADNVGKWCEENGIMLTGHMMDEPTLMSQTGALGEAMRAYRSFHLPGIDMLCDWREFSTAKQAQSAARQYGRPGVLSELYGVTNWDFDFRGHKLQGDWQAALGITVRVHHLTWVSMEGEAKRDYPACIGYQSPWYKEYRYVEDHFARLNVALTQGKAVCRVAVIHPIEGFWTIFGPNDKTAARRNEAEQNFSNIINWLLFGHIDFDFVSESLLPDLYRYESEGLHGAWQSQDASFSIGEMQYDTVIVPNCLTLRSTTLERLKDFAKKGGKVIFAGEVPTLVDGKKSNALDFATNPIAYSQTAILDALEAYREVKIQRQNGSIADWLIYQMREDEDGRWLFICNGTKPHNKDLPHREEVTITIKGEFAPTLYNTIDGSTAPLAARYENGNTIIVQSIYMHDSLLIRLVPGRAAIESPAANAHKTVATTRLQPYAYQLDEPNVLVLDMAEYAFDSEPWQPKEELLRIDNLLRDKLDFPRRAHAWAQPWTLEGDITPQNTLRLRFTISSEIECGDICLALENPEKTRITFNGTQVTAASVGYYVDLSIKKIPLPNLEKGENILLLEIPFGQATNIENCFLLGNFGVKVHGQNATVTPLPKVLPFGDSSQNGLAFYGGNVTYKCKFESKGGEAMLSASYFRCPLLKVSVNGKENIIAYAPYEISLGNLPQGEHDIEITAFGNRINTFGTLHCSDETMIWGGPDAWRTTGASWAYEYQLTPVGILKAVEVKQ